MPLTNVSEAKGVSITATPRWSIVKRWTPNHNQATVGTAHNPPCGNTPCDSHDDHCDCCECAFIVPNLVSESSSLASKILQHMTLASVSLLIQPELSSRPTFDVPSPEDAIPDSRSLRAQIAVFLL